MANKDISDYREIVICLKTKQFDPFSFNCFDFVDVQLFILKCSSCFIMTIHLQFINFHHSN